MLSTCMLCRGESSGAEVPQDAIQALDVALKHGTALRDDCESLARAFFFRNSPSFSIGNGAEVRLTQIILSPSRPSSAGALQSS